MKLKFVFRAAAATVLFAAPLPISTVARAQSEEALATVYQSLADPCDFQTFAETYPDSAFAPLAERKGAACGGTAPMRTAAAEDTGRWGLTADEISTSNSRPLVTKVLESASFSDLFQAAGEGDATAAWLAAYALKVGLGTEENIEQSVALSRQSCDAGNLRGCGGLAWLYFEGVGVERDVMRARELVAWAGAP